MGIKHFHSTIFANIARFLFIIYDETIAEAFHDVYLNKDNAKDASKYIVSILKKKLES